LRQESVKEVFKVRRNAQPVVLSVKTAGYSGDRYLPCRGYEE
jgi:hypothetical protein